MSSTTSFTLQPQELFAAARAAALREAEVAADTVPEQVINLADVPQAKVPVDPTAQATFGAPATSVPNVVTVPERRSQPGVAVYRSASLDDLYDKKFTRRFVPDKCPSMPADPAMRAEQRRLERQIETRANELQAMWKRTPASFRGKQVCQLERRRAAPEGGRDALTHERERLERVDGIKSRILAKKTAVEELLADRSTGEAKRLWGKAKLELYEHQLRRMGKVETKVVDAAEKVVDEHGLRLELLTHAETSLDPHAPPERRLGHLLNQWLSVMTGIFTLQTEREVAHARAEEARKEAAFEAEEEYQRTLRKQQERAKMARKSLDRAASPDGETGASLPQSPPTRERGPSVLEEMARPPDVVRIIRG